MLVAEGRQVGAPHELRLETRTEPPQPHFRITRPAAYSRLRHYGPRDRLAATLSFRYGGHEVDAWSAPTTCSRARDSSWPPSTGSPRSTHRPRSAVSCATTSEKRWDGLRSCAGSVSVAASPTRWGSARRSWGSPRAPPAGTNERARPGAHRSSSCHGRIPRRPHARPAGTRRTIPAEPLSAVPHQPEGWRPGPEPHRRQTRVPAGSVVEPGRGCGRSTARIGSARRGRCSRSGSSPANTVEEKVLELQATKRRLAEAIVRADESLIRDIKREQARGSRIAPVVTVSVIP